ncbi:hypothetical protein Rhow_008041 [Rhodococcus wratislaviensis]|uniref:Uncharacterized protein n=1 Tax=Rhodococcus wratislaviensis TaxID=44752 RepID=A0A402CJG1_RHOWR|nr:hypothetical protein Rhow_008041 [Rhodococcus wratislaviensis]
MLHRGGRLVWRGEFTHVLDIYTGSRVLAVRATESGPAVSPQDVSRRTVFAARLEIRACLHT